MKKIMTIVALLLIVGVGYSQDKEKRIKFNKGTLKICSLSNMKISGYNGDEVIIRSLNNQTRYAYYNFNNKNKADSKDLKDLKDLKDSADIADIADSALIKGYRILRQTGENKELENGLKPLGSKSVKTENDLGLDIIENSGELIIRDNNLNNSNKDEIKGFINSFPFNNKYELLIPNSIKLFWNTENCTKTNSNSFFVRTDSKPWELLNFKGEVEISTSYGSINLTDVSGPVIANTIGGNIKVVFDNVSPTNLYSLITNEGYIDVTLPAIASLTINASGNLILSDIDFEVLNETIINGTKGMELKLNSGKTKMKLDAGSGSVYLRKQ
jgi:hypothetical protein